MSSFYSNGLHSHQIPIQYSSFGMEREICIRDVQKICVMLPCQYGLFNTLLNHTSIKVVLKAKWGPTFYKLYLIKWPVSCICRTVTASHLVNTITIMKLLSSLPPLINWSSIDHCVSQMIRGINKILIIAFPNIVSH